MIHDEEADRNAKYGVKKKGREGRAKEEEEEGKEKRRRNQTKRCTKY